MCPDPELRPRRILVVDDNRDSADSMAMVLQFLGHEAHAVYDGEEAVLAAHTLAPDVVLLDIGLPKLDGYGAARRIREQAPDHTPVLVALTGWGQDEDRQRARDAGFDHHLTKPVTPEVIEKLIAGLPTPEAHA
jgi:CheY-like chemotaxis protein